MNRRLVFASVALSATFVAGTAAPAVAADARSTPTTAACKGTSAKAVVHTDAVKREGTLADLVSKLQARHDPYGLNSSQISTLQAASSQISALDTQIQATCYSTLAALHSDASKLFTDYRVYWLRVPQTHVIEAADHLAEARATLGSVATKLANFVGSSSQAQADLATMNQALAAADALLGTPPNAGSSIAAAAGLAPAVDMSADEAALNAAHGDLVSAPSSLEAARVAGKQVVQDLKAS